MTDFWDEAIDFSRHLRYVRNPLRRMIIQNHAEIAMVERRGLSPKRAAWLRRIVVPVSIFEILNLPFIKLVTILVFYIRRKNKRIGR